MLHQLDKFHKTTLGYLLFGIVELAIADGFFSLAVDRGNFFYYLLTLIFLVGALKNITKLIGKVVHGHKAAKTRRP